MVTALSVYGTTTASTTLTTAAALANALSGTGGSESTSIGTATGWGELYGLGNAGTWPASGSQGSPSGNGWLWDVTTLEAQQIISGNWTPSFILWLSQANTITADIWCRAYKRSSGGVYTLIGSMSLTGQTLNTTHTTYTFAASSLSAMSFSIGDKLYIDLWAHVTANTGGLTNTNIVVGVGSATGGVASRVEVDTPGYQAGVTTNTRTIPLTAALQTTKTRTIPLTSALQTTASRTVPLSTALQTTSTRTIPLSASLASQRVIPLTAALQATASRSIPLTASLDNDMSGYLPLLNQRLNFMQPQIIRTAANSVSLWCPSGVVGTYDFSNVNMQQWLNVFDEAQSLGASVIVAVNSPAPFSLLSSSWCTAFSDLINYLINTLGYTNINFVSGLSEPDSNGAAYSDYKNTIEPNLVSALSANNLTNTVTLLGPDTTATTTPSYASVILKDSPIRYYRLDESSGTVAHDLGNQAQNGTITGGVTQGVAGLIAGDTDSAMSFDGASGSISLPTTGLPTGNITLECWVKFASVPAGGTYGVMLATGGAGGDFALYYGDNSQHLSMATKGNGFVQGPLIAANILYHCVMTYDGTTAIFYVSGSSQGSFTHATTLTYGNATIGQDDIGGSYFPGIIDEVAIYSYALSASQVAAHYTAGTVPSTNDDSWLTSASSDLKSTLGGYIRHAFPSGSADISNGSRETTLKSLIAGIYANDSTNKPVIQGEMGYGFLAPGQQVATFQYGVEMADYAVQLLRAGVAAPIAYLLDDDEHGTQWGFWQITTDTGVPRPWFFPWSLLCNTIPAGSTLYAPALPNTNDFRMVAAQTPNGTWTFVLVNRRAAAQTVQLSVPWVSVATITLQQYVYSAQTPLLVDSNGFPLAAGSVSAVLARGFSVSIAANSVLILTQQSGVSTTVYDVKRPPLQKRR